MFTAKTIGTPFANQPKDINFNYNVLLLHGDGANSTNNSVFLDSSSTAATITTNGSPRQGTFTPFSTTGWSYNFNTTTTDFVVASSVPAIGTSNFTFECWVNPTTYVSSMIGGNWSPLGGNTGAWQLTISATGILQWQIYTDNNTTGTITIPTNKWTHVAISRINGTVYQFVNGVLDNIGASSISITNTGLNLAGATGGTSFNGYISNARLIIGTGLYSNAFTPSNIPITTIGNTALLTAKSNQFVGSNTTSSSVAITISGNPAIEPFSPFAPPDAYSKVKIGGSIYFNGTTDFVNTAVSSVYTLGTGDHNIEFWTYITKTGGVRADLFYLTSATITRLGIFFNGTSWVYEESGISKISSSNNSTLNAWHHVALARTSNVVSMYVDGSSIGTYTTTANWSETTYYATLGKDTNGSTFFGGYLSNLRVIKGNSLYSGSTITVPTSPVVSTSNTIILVNATNAGIIDHTQKNDMTTIGPTTISTTRSKFGGSSINFDGTTSYLLLSNLKTIGAKDYTMECWFNLNSTSFSPNFYPFIGNSTNLTGALNIRISSTTVIRVDANNSSGQDFTLPVTLTTNVWYHVAVTRNASNVTNVWLNGVRSTTGPVTIATNYGISDTVGYMNGAPAAFFNGWIDDLRLSVGIARYTSPFTPPVRQHPNR